MILAWWFCRRFLFHLSPPPFHSWRRFLLRLFGSKVGQGVLIDPGVKIIFPWYFSVGAHTWIADEVLVNSADLVTIGDNCVLSPRVNVGGGKHRIDLPTFDPLPEPTVIGSGVWLATDVFVNGGVTIGDNVVVGARSSVFKDLPANTVCIGTPAKPVRERRFFDIDREQEDAAAPG